MANSQQMMEILARVISTDMESPNSVIQFFLGHNFSGGWEGWLQAQYALAVFTEDRYQDFDRERTYPGSTKKCDLWFNPERGAQMWVELKTQRRQNYTGTITDFSADIAKLLSLGIEFLGSNVTLAAAVLNLAAGEATILNGFRSQLSSGRLNYFQYQPQTSPPWRDVTETILNVQVGTLLMLAFRPA